MALRESSEILYKNAAPDFLETLEDIEIAVREQVLENVSPEIVLFLSKEKQRREREDNEK